MITLRRDKDRRHAFRGKQEAWLTFDPQDRADPLGKGFGILEMLNEDRLLPGAGVPPLPQNEAEIVTYLRTGVLAFRDSRGCSGVIQAGEYQRATQRSIHMETNASPSGSAHIFRIALQTATAGLDWAYEQKRFTTAQRCNTLCLIASPDGRKGSLRIHQSALVYSGMLDPGQHLVHELSPQRSAWLHIVQGEVTLGEVVLTTGDGAGVTAERAVSFTAQEKTEVLLIDLRKPLRSVDNNGGAP